MTDQRFGKYTVVCDESTKFESVIRTDLGGGEFDEVALADLPEAVREMLANTLGCIHAAETAVAHCRDAHERSLYYAVQSAWKNRARA